MPAEMQESLSQFVDICEWLAVKVVNQKLTYDLNTFDLILKDNEPLFRSQRVVWRYLQNQLPGIDAVPDRTMQALNAVSQSIEEAVARRNP